MRFRVLVTALLAAALVLAVAPAALPKASAVKTTTVSVTAREFKFKLSKTSVRHGKVVFKVVNRGKLPHDFWIAGHKTKLLKPGKSATLAVTLKKGRAAYKCTVPGHAAAGMKGKLRVT